MPKDAPFAVELPEKGRDNPGWIKVGVIAAVGFVIGIAWPRVMGVRLGISAPGESAAAVAAASASAHGGRAPEPPPASIVAKGPPAVASAAAAAPVAAAPAAPVAAAPAGGSGAPNVSVNKGSVLSCKTADGDTKKGKECGPVAAIDQFVAPRIRRMSSCSGLEGQTGKLSLLVHADFASDKFSFDVGKSTTLANSDALATCVKNTFKGSSMSTAAHEHPRYTIAYNVMFADESSDKAERTAKEAPEEKKGERSEPASGEAKVAWENALVREAPKAESIVARLPRGTKVKVGTSKEGWVQIKFGDGFASEGWVHRGAIGR
jgi:hypothetical protein